MTDGTTRTGAALEVTDLSVGYETDDGTPVVLVRDVSFTVAPGEVLCLVGESGSGKSVTSLAVMGLLPDPLRVLSGSVRLGGRELLGMAEKQLRGVRGREMAMVFQDPMTSINPVHRVGHQIGRALAVHQPELSRRARAARVVELLESVGVPQPALRARGYPHEWSGGMRQRAVIAMAMANSPDVLIADEPTTALDTTVQAQVMETLAEVRSHTGAAMLLITHDLGLVAQVAQRVAIMYAGRIVELGSVWDVFEDPRHPYSRGLQSSILTAGGVGERAYAIPGSPPSPLHRLSGCAFFPRCESPARGAACQAAEPPLVALGPGRGAACVAADRGTDGGRP